MKIGNILHDWGVCIAEEWNANIGSGMVRWNFVACVKFCAFSVVGSDEREDVKGSSAGRDGHNEVHTNKREREGV